MREMRIRNGEETETIRFNTHTYISIEIYSIYALFNIISILYENEILFKITWFPTNLIKSFELGARIKSRSLIRRESQLNWKSFDENRVVQRRPWRQDKKVSIELNDKSMKSVTHSR